MVYRMQKFRSLKDIYNKYMFILSPSQKRWGVCIIIMTFIGGLCELFGVSIILPLVQVMIAPQQLRDDALLMPIIDYLHLESNVELIWALGIIVILVYIAKNLFLFLLSYVRAKYTCKVQRELSVEMMNSYMKRGYAFFLNIGTSELMRGISGSVSQAYIALGQLFKLLAEVLTTMLICIYIMSSDFIMAICVIVLVTICLLVVVLIFQRWVKRCGEVYYKYSALLTKTLLHTFQGIKEVLVMGRQKFFINDYERNFLKQQKGVIGQTIATESPTYIIEAVCVSGLILTVCFKAVDADNAAAMVPQLASFAVAAFRILPSLGRISSFFNQFVFCIPGINETYDCLKEVRDYEKNISGKKIEKDIADSCKIQFSDRLSIENIIWKYPNTDRNVLEDISLDIKKGQAIAFVGKSGAGKTTLADIILGLLEPQSGDIKIDGIDINDISEKRNTMIGFVPQNANLLDDTVRRNVAFGVEDDEIDDDLVWKALEQAQLKDVVKSKPYGLDTEIGERGIRFSGGQRQRFCIARALYCNPDILILDEATSALDTETETAVMEAIEALQGHKTLIIIAHRLTTIQHCDKIYEIVNGKAVERKYEELIQADMGES